ncbi:N-acetylglucosaminidase [Staphylococcus canis]|uniref:Autolysin n=1 Tax=Staphylococcus canis TaxID=2724942 RepID=A0ABS0T775_9STAP|nr:N-acetylglucosaminidase [Staphylococcus canis]MBI5974595.1 autolysin [Staphylococcus canis]
MMRWIKEKPMRTIIIAILAIFFVLFIINETSLFKNDIHYTFDEAVGKQTSNGILHTQEDNGRFLEASRENVAEAMKIKHSDSDLMYMDISEPVRMSKEEVNTMLKGNGILEGHGQDFLDAQDQYDVNVIYLVSHAQVETGKGQSELANGIEQGKKRYFNFFGIGAFDRDAIETGSSYAQQAEWTTPEKAIEGGAKFIRTHYFENGQITLYQMRWNPKEPGTHQYASDIDWARNIAQQMAEYYDKYGIKKDDIRKNFYK